MRVFLLLVLCLYGQFSYSQTKNETEEWIKYKIEENGLTNIHANIDHPEHYPTQAEVKQVSLKTS